MASNSAWKTVAHDPPARADWADRPRYAPSDFITLLWRERYLMLGVFLVIFAVGAGLAFTLKKTYPATSSILVQLGQEYVYEPRAGDAARGAIPDTDQVVQSETEILSSAQLRERVIRKIGLGRLYPAMAEEYAAATPSEKRRLLSEAVDGFGRKLSIDTAPETSVIRLTFEHDEPDMAARALNTLLEEYLVFRRSVLLQPTSPALGRQRVLFEEQLSQADAAYQNFLSSNGIGDFTAQKAALTQLHSQIEAQRYTTEAQLQERQGRLAALDAQMAGVAPEIGLYRDANTAAADKLGALRLQREELLSRYRPDAQPVKDIELQIASIEQGIGAGRTQTDGARRFGVNPVHQTLQTEKIQVTAEVAALRQSQAALESQLQQVTERILRLGALEPQFQELARDRDVLQTNVRDFATREVQDETVRRIAGETSDNIRIVERATPPAKGKSLRRPVLVLSFLFAAFTALCVGLARMFLRPGLPTSASASRTLDLPVLGTARMKA